jgi:hypothetical protein
MPVTRSVDYLVCARRHGKDAETLQQAGARPNAGQLYGLSVECALKAVLVQLGAGTLADGTIQDDLKHHVPRLITDLTVLPDGRPADALHAAVPHLARMRDWKVEHRYWRARDIPLDSLAHWQAAAREMLRYLDGTN